MADWKSKAQQWVSWDPNQETKAEIQRLIDGDEEKQLEQLLEKRLSFGTAGTQRNRRH